MLSRLTLFCAALLVWHAAGHAQEPCSKRLEEAPSLSGLKPGMTIGQAQAILGSGIKIPRKKNGEGSFFQNFIDRPAAGSLSGVRALFLRFFDYKIYQIEIFYEDNSRPMEIGEFVRLLSADLNLPPAAWKINNARAEMNCGDFILRADTILNPHVELTDEAGYEQFQKKRQEEKRPGRRKKT